MPTIRSLPSVGAGARYRSLDASALEGIVGDNIASFKNGRQLAAFLDLVPRQHSRGGKQRLQGISKRGDGYLRRLLVRGARAVLHHIMQKPEMTHCWLQHVAARRNMNIACVAQVNKRPASSGRCWFMTDNSVLTCPPQSVAKSVGFDGELRSEASQPVA